MRFAAWSDGYIRSTDGRHTLRFGDINDRLSAFVIECLDKTEQEFICLIPSELCDPVYRLLRVIIPDNATITRLELIAVVKKVSNAGSGLLKKTKLNDFDERL